MGSENRFMGDNEMPQWIDKVRGHTIKAGEERYQEGIQFEKYHSVEMKPAKFLPIYQFKLYGVPDNQGACLFVQPDSDIIHHLGTDDVLAMKYLPKKDNDKFALYETRIQSISIENKGPFSGFYKVGISIADEQ